MRDSAFAQKLDEILRICKILLRSTPNHPNSQDDDEKPNRDTKDGTITTTGSAEKKSNTDKTKSWYKFWQWSVSDRIQACVGLLIAATFAYSVRSYNLSVETRNIQLRAYVNITKIDFLNGPLEADRHNVVGIEYKNSGQTPARYLHSTISDDTGFTGSSCQTPDQSTPEEKTGNIMVLGSGSIGSVQDFGFTIPQECVKSIFRGTSILKIHGVITYDDVFGNTRHTKYCVKYENQVHQFVGCPDGKENDAD